ncbi:Hypothetical predicted protein [Octopus vulgaris]|uniref:Craniofacial development protein 2-like n=1 Tax=Octopus vulgaris TaxID=6645 RepID=A0AA36BI85_OCTVU|nr:Hypothetical predicted protein [Octopus vulgaris]
MYPQHDASYHLNHSGPTDNSGLHGVAFALNDRANASLLAWEPISLRLTRIRLKGSVINISVIVVYAPTLNAPDEDKDFFYDALQAVVDRIPASDIPIIAGDWNARTGPSNTTNDHILGRFAIGNQCANRERLVNFAAAQIILLFPAHAFNIHSAIFLPGTPMTVSHETRLTIFSLEAAGRRVSLIVECSEAQKPAANTVLII